MKFKVILIQMWQKNTVNGAYKENKEPKFYKILTSVNSCLN